MKASVIFAALLPAVLAVPRNPLHARQEEPAPTPTPTLPSTNTSVVSATSTSSEVPCPTAPESCLAKPDGHLICMAGGVWCRYTDERYGSPGFFPVNYQGPCAACLPSW